MSKRTFVCFACRTTERVPIARLTRTCRKCHAPAEHVYYKFRIPRADDERGWRELMPKVRDVNRKMKERALQRLRADEERYSRMLPSQTPSRAKAVEATLRAIREKIGKWEQWP